MSTPCCWLRVPCSCCGLRFGENQISPKPQNPNPQSPKAGLAFKNEDGYHIPNPILVKLAYIMKKFISRLFTHKVKGATRRPTPTEAKKRRWRLLQVEPGICV